MGGSAKNAGIGAVAGSALGGVGGGVAGGALGGSSIPGLPSGGMLGNAAGMFGAGTGIAGTGIQGPKLAPIQQGTSVKDVNKAEKAVGNNAKAQQDLLAALQAQSGLGLQTGIINHQQDLAQKLAAANGVGTQNQAIAGLQNTANMYGNIAQGVGPNPAQAMLNQQTGQNIANQAALMAGQRGAGANAGLLARQAAMQGGSLQQNAVGQAATMQANQQLNALQGLANTQQAFGNMGGAQVGQLQSQQGAIANQANQMAGQQIAQTNQNMNAALQNQQQQQNALAGYNSAMVSNQGSVNAANAGLGTARVNQQGSLIGGLMQGAGAAAGMAEGGYVHLAMGGPPDYAAIATQSPQSDFTMLANNGPMSAPHTATPMFDSFNNEKLNEGASGLSEGLLKKSSPQQSQTMTAANKGSLSEAPASMSAPNVMMAANGGLANGGGHVDAKPGQEAVKSGDSYANDKIPAKLSEGEIVLPRSVTMSEDPMGAAAEFVRQTLAKEGKTNHLAEGGKPVAEEILKVDAPIQDMPQGGMPQPQAPITSPDAMAPQPQQPQQQQQAPQMGQPQQPQGDPDEEDLVKYNTDLASGAITPETYSSLYAKKDTLGKIGTIFGLLVSGAGSGLTHQPNALLDMMNKEIERDLQAQRATKESARNFLSLEAENRMKNAQTQGQQIGNVTSGVQAIQKAGEVGAGLNFILNTNPEAKKMIEGASQQINQIMDDGKASARAKITAGHNVMIQAQKTGNPQAIATAQTVQQAANASAADDLKKAKAKASMVQAKKDMDIQNVYKMAAPVDENAYNGALYSKLLDPQAGKEEKQAIEQNRKDFYQFMDTFDKLAAMPLAGEAPGSGKLLTKIANSIESAIGGKGGSASAGVGDLAQKAFERERQIQIDGLYSAMSGRMTKEEIENLLPSFFDKNKSRGDAARKIYEKFKNSPAENAINLKRLKLLKPFPKYIEKDGDKAVNEQLDAELRGQAKQAARKK